MPTGDVERLAQVLVAKVYQGHLDRTPWTWPLTWEDNARSFVDLFRSVVAGATR